MAKEQEHQPEQIFALIIVVLGFIWVACAGSSRLMKVLDRRSFLLFPNRNFQQQQQPNINMNVGSGSLRGSLATTPRRSTTGEYRNMYSVALTDSLLSDNRFWIGVSAAALGVCRASYILSFLMLENSKGGPSISGNNVLADTVSAPLAILYYSLLTSILWALRELLSRVRSTLPASSSDNTGSNNRGRFPNNNNRDSVTSTPLSTNSRPTTNNNNKLNASGNTPEQSYGSNNNNNINNNNGEYTNYYSEDAEENQQQQQNTITNFSTADGSTVVSGAGGFDDDDESCCTKMEDLFLVTLRPYRSFITIIVLVIVILLAFIPALTQPEGSDARKLVPAIFSTIISFVLAIIAVVSSAESFVVLRKIGIAAHRVCLAITVMAVFLLCRGALIAPPVQQKLCGDNETYENFWRCSFLYDFIDAAAVLLIMHILP